MVRLMDCTLRDGANVVGKGFDAEITKIVLDILTESNVPIIEFGNAGGIEFNNRNIALCQDIQRAMFRLLNSETQAESELMRLRDSQTP